MLPIDCNTDDNDRKFYYLCKKCKQPVKSCPDPICIGDGVGHHKNEKDNRCREDVPYNDCHKIYV